MGNLMPRLCTLKCGRRHNEFFIDATTGHLISRCSVCYNLYNQSMGHSVGFVRFKRIERGNVRVFRLERGKEKGSTSYQTVETIAE